MRKTLMLLIAMLVTTAGGAAERTYSVVDGAGDVPLLVMETGPKTGPAILFIHGMSQSHLAWEPQFESALAEKYHLVAFDMRGHGGSGKPWRKEDYSGAKPWADEVAAVIAKLALKNVTIVSWSFGGFVAVAYAREYGTANLHALAFSGTLAGLIDFPRTPNPDYEKILQGSRQRGALDLSENIKGYRAMPDSFTAKGLSPQAQETAFHTGLMNPSYVRRAMTSLPLANTDMVPKLNMPVLIAVGSSDLEWPAPVARKLAETLPQGQFSLYEGAGHTPSMEDPARFNAELAKLAEPVPQK